MGVNAAEFVVAGNVDQGAGVYEVGLDVAEVVGPDEELVTARRMAGLPLVDADGKLGRLEAGK